MRHYALIAFFLASMFLLLFLLLPEGLALVPLLQSGASGSALAFLGVGLLVADVFIPVPSSTVMILHGGLFGAAWGTVLSVLGGLGAAVVGFFAGRAGGPLVERTVTPEERRRFDRYLRDWGILTVALTRPIPIVAETVAVLAGTSAMGAVPFAAAAAIGVLPTAALYALVGAAVITSGSWLVVLACVALIAVAGHLVARRVRIATRTAAPETT